MGGRKNYMKDLDLGLLFGYHMILKDVPEERAEHVKKLATKHLERMAEALNERTFGAFHRDMEVAKSLAKT